jgi:hypothetical protein
VVEVGTKKTNGTAPQLLGSTGEAQAPGGQVRDSGPHWRKYLWFDRYRCEHAGVGGGVNVAQETH